jgi:hypothetical protein
MLEKNEKQYVNIINSVSDFLKGKECLAPTRVICG